MQYFGISRGNPTRIGLVLLCGATLAPLVVQAQEYRGTILGQVTDQKGGLLPKVTVTATSNLQTYTVQSDGRGDYTIPFVQPGTYTITAEAQGFRQEVHPGIIIDVSTKINVNFNLSVGSANEKVDVREDALQLSTADASGGTVMDPEKIQNLPLNGRQVYQLLQLTPGVRSSSVGFSGTRGWDVNNNYNISGQPGFTNQFLLNGAPISIQGGGPSGTWTISPSVDAVQEFKVMTITFDAQYGRVGGGPLILSSRAARPTSTALSTTSGATPFSTPIPIS